MNGYRPLEKSFTSRTFLFTEIKRENDLAIYHKTKPGTKINNFEVIQILRHKDYEIAGVKIAAAETFPSAEQWGTYGFSYDSLEKAEDRFNRMKLKRLDILL